MATRYHDFARFVDQPSRPPTALQTPIERLTVAFNALKVANRDERNAKFALESATRNAASAKKRFDEAKAAYDASIIGEAETDGQ
ncbi:MAG: hypothetical protein AAFQ67_00710 [Pseudomonadota bacterium]